MGARDFASSSYIPSKLIICYYSVFLFTTQLFVPTQAHCLVMPPPPLSLISFTPRSPAYGYSSDDARRFRTSLLSLERNLRMNQCVPSKMRMSSQFSGKKVRWLKVLGVVLILLLHYMSATAGQYNDKSRRTSIGSRRNEEEGAGGSGGSGGGRRKGPGSRRTHGQGGSGNRSKKGKKKGGKDRDRDKERDKEDDRMGTPPPSIHPGGKKRVHLAVILPWYGLLG